MRIILSGHTTYIHPAGWVMLSRIQQLQLLQHVGREGEQAGWEGEQEAQSQTTGVNDLTGAARHTLAQTHAASQPCQLAKTLRRYLELAVALSAPYAAYMCGPAPLATIPQKHAPLRLRTPKSRPHSRVPAHLTPITSANMRHSRVTRAQATAPQQRGGINNRVK